MAGDQEPAWKGRGQDRGGDERRDAEARAKPWPKGPRREFGAGNRTDKAERYPPRREPRREQTAERTRGGDPDFVAYEGSDSPEGGDAGPWGGREAAGAEDKRGRGKPHRPHHPHARSHQPRTASFEEKDGQVWIWGLHAAGAALKNPKRKITRLLVTRNAAQRLGLNPEALPETGLLMEPKDVDRALPPDSVHQGVALRAHPLEEANIDDFVVRPEKPLAILDQVTDPQNVGAVFRSAAAFGLAGVVLQTRNAPALGGSLAKAATGAVEVIDEIRTVNISRAIDALTSAGWNVVGLDGSADATLAEAFACPRPLAIVLGAEGTGLRPGVAQSCTQLARIPIGGMESLNVSNAAAIAFYEASRRVAAPPPKAARAPDDDMPEAPLLEMPGEDADGDETD